MQNAKLPNAKPLDHFPVIRTLDVDEMRGAVGQFYGENKLSVSPGYEGFHAHGNHCQLTDVGISFADFGTAVDLDFPLFSVGYSTPVPLKGGGSGISVGQTVLMTTEQTVIASPGRPLRLHYATGFEQITVQLSAVAMQRTLTSVLGAPLSTELVFEPLLDFRPGANQLWRRLLWFLIGEVEAHDGKLPLTALAEIEQALLITFLKANPNTFSHLLDGKSRDVARWQVRRAEDYIEAHWDQPITVEALALVTNASARSVFNSFKESRGYSPMVFVKRVRLRHARKMLTDPSPNTSVTDVAFTCGFSNLGHFAKDYGRTFGERPSDTLKAARGSNWVRSSPKGGSPSS